MACLVDQRCGRKKAERMEKRDIDNLCGNKEDLKIFVASAISCRKHPPSEKAINIQDE